VSTIDDIIAAAKAVLGDINRIEELYDVTHIDLHDEDWDDVALALSSLHDHEDALREALLRHEILGRQS
jgi:hypothetical protein